MKISTKQTETNIAAVLNLLHQTPLRLAEWLAELPAEQLQAPLAPGQWSIAQQLTHLLNCEAVRAQAIYHALLVDQPQLPEIHPQRHWDKLGHYAALPLAERLTYFRLRRSMLLQVLEGLSDGGWAREGRRNGKRPESVYRLALHEAGHLADIEARLS